MLKKIAVVIVVTGLNSFMAQAFGVFMDMDKLVGTEFEKGLATLDSVTAQAKAG